MIETKKTKRLELRLSSYEYGMLEDTSKVLKMSKSELLRKLINDKYMEVFSNEDLVW